MDIEIRLLRSFVAIHEAGSLSRAAARLGCTQAAMSMRLKSLEADLGGELFTRGPRGLQATARGAELHGRALAVLAAYDEMLSHTRSRPRRARVRLGLPDDYAQGFLGPLLAAMAEDGGTTDLVVDCDLSGNLVAALGRHDLDLALVTLAARPAQLVAEWSVPLLWAHAPDRAPDAAAPVPLAAYPEGCVFRRAMVGALESAGRGWHVAVQSRSQAALMAAVRAGVAVTSVARGTGAAGLVETSGSEAGLPPLPEVPLSLIASTALPARAGRVLGRLQALIDARFGKAAAAGTAG